MKDQKGIKEERGVLLEWTDFAPGFWPLDLERCLNTEYRAHTLCLSSETEKLLASTQNPETLSQIPGFSPEIAVFLTELF